MVVFEDCGGYQRVSGEVREVVAETSPTEVIGRVDDTAITNKGPVLSPKEKPTIGLFYSYCHKDAHYRTDMDKNLHLLEDFGLSQWSDEEISPGRQFNYEIRNRMKEARILVYLISPDFIRSTACKEEWKIGKQLSAENGSVLIPIILRRCAWKDFDTMRDYLALPTDGQPVSSFDNPDDAWAIVYDGIKVVLEEECRTPQVKPEFINKIARLDLITQRKQKISLSDVFEFPVLTSSRRGESTLGRIQSVNMLLRSRHALLHGDVLSGKSALCINLFQHLANGPQPALYVDLNEYGLRRPSLKTYQEIFEDQAKGSFSSWRDGDTTLILDNLNGSADYISHLRFCIEHFDAVYAGVLSDVFYAFFFDEPLVSEFLIVNIEPLSHVKQERLIKRWLSLGESSGIPDGNVDRLEAEVNSVIVDNRVLPRYPYFVLSILQMREGFMPTNLSVTAYGHCHYMMILAHLLNSGIEKEDSEIDACMNFASEFAYFLFNGEYSWNRRPSDNEMDAFVSDYGERFLLGERTLSRLRHPEYGLVKDNKFKASYMYYYFLGKYLANHERDEVVYDAIRGMAEECYLTDNSFALISLVHHSTDTQVIDDLVIRNLCSLDHIAPATLRNDETQAIREMISDLPRNVISNNSVEEEREFERRSRDDAEEELDDLDESSEDEGVNDVYRILKCNEILAQILRNRYGSLTKDKIGDIICSISDGGLRLVRVVLLDKRQIRSFAKFIQAYRPDIEIERLSRMVVQLMFAACVILLERIAGHLNKKEILELVHDTLGGEPADHVLRYLTWLETGNRFAESAGAGRRADVERLERVWEEQKDEVVRRIVSVATQRYVNTHRVSAQSRQSIGATLQLTDQRRTGRGR